MAHKPEPVSEGTHYYNNSSIQISVVKATHPAVTNGMNAVAIPRDLLVKVLLVEQLNYFPKMASRFGFDCRELHS